MKLMTKKKIFASAMTLGIVGLFALPMVVGAAPEAPKISDLEGTLGNSDLTTLISSIIAVVMSFLGIVAVLIMLWGGFIWMTAGGEQDKVDKAKKLIVSGIIGLVIIFAAYAIASFVMQSMTNITNANVAI